MAQEVYTPEQLTKMVNEHREALNRLLGLVEKVIDATVTQADYSKIEIYLKPMIKLINEMFERR